MITKESRLIKTAEEQFAAWLSTQSNANGAVFIPKVANSYARNLRTEPPKLDIPLSLGERDVFRCRTTAEFDELNSIFRTASNFREINRRAEHGAFSAGLAAYRRYMIFLERNGESEVHGQSDFNPTVKNEDKPQIINYEPQRVDFAHPEYCTGCDPVTCIVEGKDFSGGNWRDILIALTEDFLMNKPSMQELVYKSIYKKGERPFLLKEKPQNGLAARQISNGCWVLLNLGIKDLVFAIRKLCEFCRVDLDDVDITYIPKQSTGRAKPVNETKGESSRTVTTVPDALIEALNKHYITGFRFDTTYMNLLSNASGIEVSGRIQSALKRIMFCRDDGVYFLLDNVADVAIRKDIVDFADAYLRAYGCFEIPELYKLYKEKINPNCIRNADDFESFYVQIAKSGIRCVQAPQIGHRIARYSNDSVWGTFKEVADKLVAVITEEYYGSCNEDDLQAKFCAFSTDLLCKIIKSCAPEDLIRVEINGSICYQTYDALGLPDNFSDVLAGVLDQLSEVGLEPTRDVLHTAISLNLGVNFMAEYNLPDWDTYQRLVSAFYKAEPRRAWKHQIFEEATN